tara:strand:+ start:430 stop:651 length:222 start_codon:yes stop_codon:yes gene_type:complete
MLIDNLKIYKFENEGTEKKPNLQMTKHLVDEDCMNIKKLPRLLDDLSDAWSCNYNDLQIQIRFVPRGTGADDV